MDEKWKVSNGEWGSFLLTYCPACRGRWCCRHQRGRKEGRSRFPSHLVSPFLKKV